jgi:hypothetical protein
MTEYTKFLNRFSKLEQLFLNCIEETNESEWLLKCIDFFDCVDEIDFETAWNLHSKEISSKTSKKIIFDTFPARRRGLRQH